MQIVSGIGLPVADEHVLDTDPVLAPELPDVWLRRLRAFPGRAVAATALGAEQDSRAGRTRLRGQSVSPGVVRGLGVTLEPAASGAAPGDAMIQVAPGFGLARTGEDIAVASPRRLRMGDLPVYARADWLDSAAAGTAPGASLPAPSGGVAGGVFAGLAGGRARRMAASFGALIGSTMDGVLPRAAVLVAEPVTAEIVGRQDPADPCPADPADDPYDDWRRIDGCRLALYLWPSEFTSLPGLGTPDYSLPPPGPALRNQLAWRIFHAEAAMLPGEMHPWEALGVPLALLGFGADWSPLFADRSAVLRTGGLPRPRSSPVTQGGTAFLWQARLSQLVEQLGELGIATLSADTLAQAVRELPPVGLLPPAVLDAAGRTETLFPPGWTVSAVPIAIEQLDLALRPSAPLAPFNLSVPDTVELLVPVPERVYEPGLLQTAMVDGLFGRTVARFTSDRTLWMVRRELVRRRRDALTGALSGALPSWPATDPDEIDGERLANPTLRPPVSCTRFRRVTTTGLWFQTRFSGAQVPMPLVAGDELFVWVRIVPGAVPGGLSLGVAAPTPLQGDDWSAGAYWGDRNTIVQFDGDPDSEPRRAGDLPPPGVWTRLSRPVTAVWGTGTATLAQVTVDGAAFTQLGGTVEWGPFGKRDQAGNETVWLGDEAPAGTAMSTQTDAQNEGDPSASVWIDADPADEQPAEDDFGTVRAGDARASLALDARASVALDARASVALTDFRARWTMPFLAADFATLATAGLDGMIAALTTRLQATNDALDLGFTRARADIYRVRQYVLGADAASRLVTSPTLADIATRDDGARATSDQIRAFVTASYITPPSRDPNNPMLPVPTPPTAPSAQVQGAAAQAQTGQPAASRGFSRSLFTSTALRANVFQASTGGLIGSASEVLRPTDFAVSSLSSRSELPETVLQRSQAGVALASGLAFRPTYSISDVQLQLPLPGFAERSAAVGERLTEPPALEAYRYALDGKQTVLSSLLRLIAVSATPDPAGRTGRPGIGLDDLALPGFALQAGVAPATGRITGTLADYAAHPADYIDSDELTGLVTSRHESDYFTAAVAATDNAIALMRLAEGRTALYGQFQADAGAVRDDIAGALGLTDPRLRAIEAQLVETRHDLASTAALLAEEQSRVAALNAQRTAVLRQYVSYLAYRRPRSVDREIAAPVSPADPAMAEDAVAVCTRTHPFVPDELRTMAGLFREAPIRWLPTLWPQLALLDDVGAVFRTAETVQRRAPYALPFLQQAPASVAETGGTRYLAFATAALSSQRASIYAIRAASAQFDLGAFSQLGLAAARSQLLDLASPADLLDGAHGRGELIRRTGDEVDGIAQVAACLYASFGEVLPALRIGWAELLIGLDGTVPLQSLATLPRWSELAIEQRREQQGLVDWLFGRIDTGAAPLAAMNDLVRVAVLMACHAPVDQIVGAAVARAAPARIGGYIDLATDLTQVHVGMSVLVRDAAGLVQAQASVEDVGGGLARARIVQAADSNVMITAASRVQLTHFRLS